jgi:hypothetical protein
MNYIVAIGITMGYLFSPKCDIFISIYLIYYMFLYKNMQKVLTNWHKYDRGIWV